MARRHRRVVENCSTDLQRLVIDGRDEAQAVTVIEGIGSDWADPAPDL